jgi:SET domain-containing protein|tara:strand:+ start:29 stop:379 length:351 start_codon:yes stop_codon:yes gene_type:complete
MAFKMKKISFTDKPYSIKKSKIAGIGVIADKNFNKGDMLDTAIEKEDLVGKADTRTMFGKSLNHQKNCNAIQKSENNSLNVYANKNIKAGEEITINYNNAPLYVRAAVNTKNYKEQ